jgi:hypothetical protein
METTMTFEYAPAPESRAIVTIKPKYGHFIGGKFVPGGKHFPTINPATEEVLSQIALGARLMQTHGQRCLAKSVESICIASPASCRSVHVNLQY